MNGKNILLKLGFGLVIFAFALAFAYFTASYLDSSWHVDYWLALEGFAGLFVLVGIVVSSIFPVSLGFLFSASILVMHIFLQKYDVIPDASKAIMLGVILIILYLAALRKHKDDVVTQTPAVPSSQT